MAYSDESTGMVMPVAPYGGNNGGFLGGDGWWIILLLLCGWGGMGFGGGWGGGGMNGLYPWMNQADITTSGFQNQMLNTGITSIGDKITSGFGDVQTSLCSGFAGVNATVNGAQNALAQQLYTNQIADLERSFAAQTANTQGMTALQSQLATCCCENRAATQDVKYTIATEACANRSAAAANTQAILDKLCQLELDGKNDRIAELERQLTMANLAASQNAQTAALAADNAAQTQYIVNRVAPYPIPAYTVANPNTGCCNTGCGNVF